MFNVINEMRGDYMVLTCINSPLERELLQPNTTWA